MPPNYFLYNPNNKFLELQDTNMIYSMLFEDNQLMVTLDYEDIEQWEGS